jgi:hypothetical protein
VWLFRLYSWLILAFFLAFRHTYDSAPPMTSTSVPATMRLENDASVVSTRSAHTNTRQHIQHVAAHSARVGTCRRMMRLLNAQGLVACFMFYEHARRGWLPVCKEGERGKGQRAAARVTFGAVEADGAELDDALRERHQLEDLAKGFPLEGAVQGCHHHRFALACLHEAGGGGTRAGVGGWVPW